MKCSLLTLSHYVDDELDDRRRGEMEAHLVGCARCRSGLSHIREEVERIGALAPVRVLDASAHALLVQLGLLEPDDELPERRAPVDHRATPALPPWMQGHATAALPWTPERPARPAPTPPPDPDEEHMELSGPPAAHRRLSALDAAAEMPFDLTVLAHDSRIPLMPRSTTGSLVVEVEERKPLEWLPPPATGLPPPAIPEPPPAPADSAPLTSAAPPPDAAAPPPPAAEVVPEDKGLPAPSSLDATSPPASDAGGAPPPASSPHDDTPHAAPPTAGDSAVAVWTSDPADAPPGAEYPITDDDALMEPIAVERFSRGPAPAPRPSLVDRLRDRLAVRRALNKSDDDTMDAGIEIVSGTGAPARMRARSDLARRRAEALRPHAAAGVDDMPPARRHPGAREMLAPPARPMSAMPVEVLDRPAPPAAPEPDDGREVTGQRVRPPGRDDPAAAASRSGQRAVIAYAAAIAVIGAVGIISGRVSTPIPGTSSSATSQTTIPLAPPANSGSVGPSGSASASSSASQSQSQPPASVAPSAAPIPAAPASIGTGGSGWTVQNIRVGDHGTYYRIVFDLGGAAATGEPKVELTYPDAKTLVVTITGASPSAAPPAVGSNSIVTAIAPGTGPAGTAVYRITLSKPATGKPLYLGNPLRLVVDVVAS